MTDIEEQNQDLMLKLFVANNEIEKAHSRLIEMKQRVEAYEKINFVFFEVKAKLAEAQVRLFEQQCTISCLQKRNAELLAENSILKNPQHHSESPLKAVYPNPIQRPKSSPVLQQNQDIKPAVVTQHPSPNLKISPAQVKKVKTSTIADKLKLSLAKSPNKPTPAPQKKKEEKPVTPRIVVKEIPAPTKNNKEAAKIINKTNSIMVTKLWRGLKKEDILEYFGTFGKVIAASMTDSGNEMVDGYKYLFLKFADAKAVDKVLANNGSHIIKKVSIVVKRGTHTF